MPKGNKNSTWASSPPYISDPADLRDMNGDRHATWTSSPPHARSPPDTTAPRIIPQGGRSGAYSTRSPPRTTTPRDSRSSSLQNGPLPEANDAPRDPPTNSSLTLLLLAVTLVSASDAILNRLFVFGFGVFIGARFDMRDLFDRLGLPPLP
ncbi:hypothetical protein N7528_003286 [Penicillium herquei]|nr:hypothetical protein N7528_003286 [Penicillium herquei]